MDVYRYLTEANLKNKLLIQDQPSVHNDIHKDLVFM